MKKKKEDLYDNTIIAIEQLILAYQGITLPDKCPLCDIIRYCPECPNTAFNNSFACGAESRKFSPSMVTEGENEKSVIYWKAVLQFMKDEEIHVRKSMLTETSYAKGTFLGDSIREIDYKLCIGQNLKNR